MPRYSDYHRTVIGYHGTRRSTALRIVQGLEDFGPSQNDDDWLGNGVYFWEYAPQQAWLWARQRQRLKKWDEEIAVVASMIRLGFCLDLLDPENVKDLGQIYQGYRRSMAELGSEPPANVRSEKRLNCAVFKLAYRLLEERDTPVDTCRAVFVPTQRGSRLWPGSGINAHAHIQVCVWNMECILGTWLVRPIEEPADDPEQEAEEAGAERDAHPARGAVAPEDDR